MLRFLAAGVSLMLASGFGYGQARGVTLEMRANTGCPVLVKAKYVPGARVVLVAPKESEPKSPGWPLHVDFAALAGKAVVQARITVHGISAKGGIIPAETQADSGDAAAGPWLTQTFVMTTTAKDTAKDKNIGSGTVWLTGYGAVESVRLEWARFADGTTWTAPADRPCYASQTATMITSN